MRRRRWLSRWFDRTVAPVARRTVAILSGREGGGPLYVALVVVLATAMLIEGFTNGFQVAATYFLGDESLASIISMGVGVILLVLTGVILRREQIQEGTEAPVVSHIVRLVPMLQYHGRSEPASVRISDHGIVTLCIDGQQLSWTLDTVPPEEVVLSTNLRPALNLFEMIDAGEVVLPDRSCLHLVFPPGQPQTRRAAASGPIAPGEFSLLDHRAVPPADRDTLMAVAAAAVRAMATSRGLEVRGWDVAPPESDPGHAPVFESVTGLLTRLRYEGGARSKHILVDVTVGTLSQRIAMTHAAALHNARLGQVASVRDAHARFELAPFDV